MADTYRIKKTYRVTAWEDTNGKISFRLHQESQQVNARTGRPRRNTPPVETILVKDMDALTAKDIADSLLGGLLDYALELEARLIRMEEKPA